MAGRPASQTPGGLGGLGGDPVRRSRSSHRSSLISRISSLGGRRSTAAAGGDGEPSTRYIHLNNSELNDQQKFLHNRVFTAKYTFFTFLPKFLYEEFSKYANLFFLFISGIQVRALCF